MYMNKLSRTRASRIMLFLLVTLLVFGLYAGSVHAAIVSLGEAVDNTTITLTTGGSASWYGQTTTSYYGGDSAQSGDIADSQTSWLSFNTAYSSWGTYVRFVWKVSSEANFDKLSFYIGSDLMDSISGEVNWQTKAYYLPEQTTLEWKYTKDSSVSAGSDAGWVDHVEVFTSWSAPYVGDAVDNPALTWQTFYSGSAVAGEGPWRGNPFIYTYGGSAAQSGRVSKDSYSYLRTSVTGPGTLKFWWKVSSGSGDYLIFYIDGVSQGSIGGNVDWQQKTFTITSGLHTLQWNYAKDSYDVTDAGMDAGFLDKVEFTTGVYSATIWGWDYIQGWQVPVPITKDGVATGYSTPYTFTGLTGTHTFTVPNTNSAGHPFSDWSTDWTDRTITISSAGTYTARYRAGYSVTIWSWCAIEGWLSSSITKDGVATGYSTPHTFTGLTGTHTFTVPNTDASGHTFYEWSTGATSKTITVTSAGVYAARYKLATASAHIYVQHTYRGDLVVDIGVGNTASPLWSTRVSNRQGGSADNLDLTVDLSAATAYLPPSNTYRWFLKVYDAASGDQGQITQFSITYQGVTYTSKDVPVPVTDLKTSYAYIPTPVSAQAHVYIQHTYRGDLIVDIGVGSTSTPLWSKRIWSGTGGSADNLDLYVDLSGAVAYLPPSTTYTWWVKVYDKAAGDTGKIVTFTITYQGKTYTSPDVPVPILDLKTTYAYIKG